MKYFISEISEIINAQLISKENCDIEYILIDSRNIITTQNTIFCSSIQTLSSHQGCVAH